MISNSLNANLPATLVQQLVSFLVAIANSLPFLISLTPEERMALQSVSDGRLPYVQKCLEYCKAHRVKIGMSVEDLSELEAQALLFEQLGELLHLTEDIRTGLRDTHMQVSHNYFRLSRIAHGQMKLAYAKGRPGMEVMIDALDKLFENQGKSKSNPEDNADGGAQQLIPGNDKIEPQA